MSRLAVFGSAAALLAVAALGSADSVAARQRADAPIAPPPAPVGGDGTRNIPYEDARRIIAVLREDLVPVAVKAGAAATRPDEAWDEWVARRDAEIRLRLDRADEDSVLNFALFGTSFTVAPRLSERDVADMADGQAPPAALAARIAALAAGIAAPGENARLHVARAVVTRHGRERQVANDPTAVRAWLEQGIARLVSEYERLASVVHDPATNSVERSTLYKDRGLSSDTTIAAGFGIDQALEAVAAQGLLRPGTVRRVAVVGPGLDFTDKHEGYDFYPLQTLQPFAVLDSLGRLGLAGPVGVQLSAFDLSTRVNTHLNDARLQAGTGQGYLLHLPRADAPFAWTPFLAQYWQRFGASIGTKITAMVPAPAGVQVRAIRVPPEMVSQIGVTNLNIVLQRLEPATTTEGFDLIVATNVLLYYDVFEQALALANIAHMLRPDGLFLSNTLVPVLPAIALDMIGYSDVGYTARPDGDRVFWYKR